jgi:hypothetical protein
METLLTSWNDAEARDAIVAFVRSVSSEGSASFIAPAERVAVFDNDGTLWSEKPIPIQLDFTLFRMAELARQDPALLDRQPYKAAVERDYRWLGEAMVKHYHGDNSDLKLLMGAVESAFQGMGVEAFAADALGWLKAAAPATAPALPVVRLHAHGRTAALPGSERLHHLHRLGR